MALAIFIFAVCPLSRAAESVFTAYPAGKLKVIETYEDTQTALLESPYGETTTVGIGDIVGEEEATVIKIQQGGIMLEEPPGDTGIPIKSFIPVGPQGARVGGQ